MNEGVWRLFRASGSNIRRLERLLETSGGDIKEAWEPLRLSGGDIKRLMGHSR